MSRRLPSLLILSLGCGSARDKAPTASDTSQAPEGDPATIPLGGLCPLDARWGAFAVEAYDAYAIVAGSAADGVLPISVLTEVASEGDCRLMRRENPYCSPTCGSGETCGLDGVCVPYPAGQDLGTVAVTGLVDAVSMAPSTPGYTYSDTDLSFPLFEAGKLIALQSSGPDALLLHGVGVAPLTPTETQWNVSLNTPLSLAWDTPTEPVRSEIALTLNIDQHGTTPVNLQCTFPDTGSAEVPASVLNALFDAGVSGYPSASLARRTSDKAAFRAGCVDLTVSQEAGIDLTVEGHTPCEDNTDCPIGHPCDTTTQTCL